MTATVTPHPNVNRQDIWPGHVDLDRTGVALAVEMFDEMAEDTDVDRVQVADMCCLEDWPRNGQPFRNIVAEYLERARQAGPAALYAFTAVLSDLAGLAVQGSCRDVENYAEHYGIE